ncbi:unnamed protein product [Adineta ricciae]|uniref:Uncharacterized protein n=1 Tax=Adineta ricciae TaxID=249248 RepID=A0A814YBA8_ADIRI|nr:unnamed protein product [Adineta ricciae]
MGVYDHLNRLMGALPFVIGFTVIAAAIFFCVQSRRTLRLSSLSTHRSCEQFQRSSEHDRDDNQRVTENHIIDLPSYKELFSSRSNGFLPSSITQLPSYDEFMKRSDSRC